MNADGFCEHLRLLAPTSKELRHWGMDESGLTRIRNGYFCARHTTSNEPDPLIDLCTNFDVSTVEIGMITFAKPKELSQQTLQVGVFEADPLVLYKSGGEVAVRDHEDLKREFCVCARNSESFLDALLIAAKFFTKCLAPETSENTDATLKTALEQSVLSAGGKKYEAFFSLLLGPSD